MQLGVDVSPMSMSEMAIYINGALNLANGLCFCEACLSEDFEGPPRC